MEAKDPVDYSHYIENENEALPATAIHRHAQAGYNTTAPGEKVCFPGIETRLSLSSLLILRILSARSWNNYRLRLI